MLRACLLPLLVLLLAGCGDTVISPFAPNDHYFSVYGYVDTATDSHFVRIIPSRRRLERPSTPPVADMVVTTTEVETGRVENWSVYRRRQPDGAYGTRFDDGTYGIVFASKSLFFPGRTYTLEVRRPDGLTSRAEVTLPPSPTYDLQPARLGEDGLTQSIHWRQLVRPPHRVTMRYAILSPSLPETMIFSIAYPPEGEEAEEGRRYVIDVERDIKEIQRRIAATYDLEPFLKANPTLIPIGILYLRMRLTLLDATWHEAVQHSPDVLAQPGAYSNIENGFGFFGGRGQFDAVWELRNDAKAALGIL